MSKTKEVAVKNDNAIELKDSPFAAPVGLDVGQFDGVALDTVDSDIFDNDIVVPKIWLIQSISELRKQKKAEEGEFVDSQTGEILAKEGETLRFSVLKTFKRWHDFGDRDKKDFKSSYFVTPENSEQPYEDTVDGEDVFRRQVIGAYIILERDLMRGIDKVYILEFASTSKHGGRKLITDINNLNKQKYPAFVGHWELSAKEETFPKGSCHVKDTKFGGYMTKDAIPFLLKAHKNIEKLHGEDRIATNDGDIIDGEFSNASTGARDNGQVPDGADI